MGSTVMWPSSPAMPTRPWRTLPPMIRAEGEEDEVVDLASGAHPFFAEGGGVGVVFEDDGGAEAFFDGVADGEVLEFGEIVGADDEALFEEDETGDADADASEAVAGEFFADADDLFDDVVDDGVAALGEVGCAGDVFEDFAVAIDRGGAHVGSAEVESDGVVEHVLA